MIWKAALPWMIALVGALSAASATAAGVGQAALDFSLKSTTGKNISLGDYRGKKNVVLQFYVLDFTPG